MNCRKVWVMLPGYLDGAAGSSTPDDQHAHMREHLEGCNDCRRQLESYRKLSALMSRAIPAIPPADLAVRIRVAVSQARETQQVGYLRKFGNRANLLLENLLQPIALPATGGFVSSMLVFVVVLQMIAPGMALTIPNDVPINLMREASLESLASFPALGPLDSNLSGTVGQHGLLIDVTVDSQGQMVDYRILTGPNDRVVRRQLEQVLMFSRFRPQMSFGRPTAGGHVVISFNEVRVKG
ncbi:MAG TPA: zf-HC2 domain-containing protein [Candidatus Dormibacteraeota bacterium]|nr:zf-HC2 domain-containing protein [Candidatus Dormibacteraeota bacterium]